MSLPAGNQHGDTVGCTRLSGVGSTGEHHRSQNTVCTLTPVFVGRNLILRKQNVRHLFLRLLSAWMFTIEGVPWFAWTLPVSALEIPHPQEMPQNQANQKVGQPRTATICLLSLDETPEL